MKIAILFPGQGSQYLGMGSEFMDNKDESLRGILQQAEKVCNLPLGAIMQDGPMEELTRAAILQPAITTTNLICWQAMEKVLGDKEIHCFAGHSLGEYSALCAAGVLSVEDTLKLVAKRGELMEREGITNPGGMRAVLGLEIEKVEEIIATCSGDGVVSVANHNTPQQVVIAGDSAGLDAVSAVAEEAGAKVKALNVSVANHSPLVAEAVPDFVQFMQGIEFRKPNTPIYFNVSANPCGDPAEIKEMMGKQIVSRVRWYEIITSMIDDGVDTFIEVGPKTVLKGMIRKIKPKGVKLNTLQCDTPDTLAACIDKL